MLLLCRADEDAIDLTLIIPRRPYILCVCLCVYHTYDSMSSPELSQETFGATKGAEQQGGLARTDAPTTQKSLIEAGT